MTAPGDEKPLGLTLWSSSPGWLTPSSQALVKKSWVVSTFKTIRGKRLTGCCKEPNTTFPHIPLAASKPNMRVFFKISTVSTYFRHQTSLQSPPQSVPSAPSARGALLRPCASLESFRRGEARREAKARGARRAARRELRAARTAPSCDCLSSNPPRSCCLDPQRLKHLARPGLRNRGRERQDVPDRVQSHERWIGTVHAYLKKVQWVHQRHILLCVHVVLVGALLYI